MDTQTAARFPPVIMQIGYRLPVKTPDKNNANPQRAIGYLQIRVKKKKKIGRIALNTGEEILETRD